MCKNFKIDDESQEAKQEQHTGNGLEEINLEIDA